MGVALENRLLDETQRLLKETQRRAVHYKDHTCMTLTGRTDPVERVAFHPYGDYK